MSKTKPDKFIWWRDKKIIGMILLIIACTMQIFAFLKVPFISSIHGYTIGMLMGFFNPFFYFFIIFKSLKMIFGKRIFLPKWIKINTYKYVFLALAIIFVASSTSFYQNKIGYNQIGLSYWKSFEIWYIDFTDAPGWLPNNTNGGIIGAFLFSFFAMFSTGIGALVISIILLISALALIFLNSILALIKKQKNLKRGIKVESKKLKSPPYKRQPIEKIPPSSNFTGNIALEKTNPLNLNKQDNWDIKISKTEKLRPLQSPPINKPIPTRQEALAAQSSQVKMLKKQKNTNSNEIDLPFEDPFI